MLFHRPQETAGLTFSIREIRMSPNKDASAVNKGDVVVDGKNEHLVTDKKDFGNRIILELDGQEQRFDASDQVFVKE